MASPGDILSGLGIFVVGNQEQIWVGHTKINCLRIGLAFAMHPGAQGKGCGAFSDLLLGGLS